MTSKDIAGSELAKIFDCEFCDGEQQCWNLKTEKYEPCSCIEKINNLVTFIAAHDAEIKQQAIKEFGEKLSLDCQNCGRRTPYFEAELRNFNTGMCAACGADALTISFWELDSIITAIQEAMKETN